MADWRVELGSEVRSLTPVPCMVHGRLKRCSNVTSPLIASIWAVERNVLRHVLRCFYGLSESLYFVAWRILGAVI